MRTSGASDRRHWVAIPEIRQTTAVLISQLPLTGFREAKTRRRKAPFRSTADMRLVEEFAHIESLGRKLFTTASNTGKVVS